MKRLLAAFLLCAASLVFAAAESLAVPIFIQSFSSTVDVRGDGSILVEERLLVRTVEGGHGIYRGSPVTTRWRKQGRAAMDVLSVAIDGEARPSDDIVREGNIVRVYQRNKARELVPGVHEFVLRYVMTGQVGMFEKNDELTWNVTGHEWENPIGSASCVVLCPAGAGFYGQKAWHDTHGGFESGGVRMEHGWQDGRVVMRFATTRPVQPGEELTVAAGWEKGFVTLPSGSRDLDSFAELCLAVLDALLLAYFTLAWYFRGRDPKKGVVIPLFHPPVTGIGQAGRKAGPISPCGVSYLHNKAAYAPKCLGVALLSLATRGICAVNGGAKQGFVLRRKAGTSSFNEENALLEAMPHGELPVDSRHGEELYGMLNALLGQIDADFGSLWKGSHGKGLVSGLFGSVWTVLGFAAAAIGLSSIVVMIDPDLLAQVLGVFAVFLGAFFFLRKILWFAKRSWQSRNFFGCVVLLLFALPLSLTVFGGFAWGFGGTLFQELTWEQMALMLLAALIPLGFSFIMDAPTPEARKLLDGIEGLAMYIGMAERDRLNLINPPELTAAHFQELMPYAVALDLEEAWGRRFADVVDMQAAAPARDLMLACSALSGQASSSAASYAGAQAASSSSSFGGGGGGAGGGGGGGGGGGC
jgi:uncharacterized membrane protein YgcG